ncbi:ABC transporter ATP-binding protein [Nitrospirillum iridis]|uniref:Oligopeptide/dipeptide ABC transporter ATP-binding protein n=1 Tax=Nitrospirillum iridis TaxID=765888 RepID=A0A7X0EGU9_9PROT|nr:ABC transporter ATP-binding protein [Nitrospirillum iridis]MBB6255315.1 oligopeptide/dipeptide ABC transporter ATP-binding protein [Nitrospirillum iridis]
MALLDIRDLRVAFPGPPGEGLGPTWVVDGVTLALDRGQSLALIGESGSGKSVTARSILRLNRRSASEPAPLVSGEIRFDGTDLLALPDTAMRQWRGSRIAMVFQEPMTAFDPLMSIGGQIAEAIRLHQPLGRRAARERAVELLGLMRFPDPRRQAGRFPHQVSGGMRQRAMIAMALACEPDLLIADEPTTALDVTTQAGILDLLNDLRRDLGMALLLITHDLAVAARVADHAAIMYAGGIVESGPLRTVFDQPRHPYTHALLALERLDRLVPRQRLPEIPGTVPPPAEIRSRCAFAPRCGAAGPECRSRRPSLATAALATNAPGRQVACFHPIAAGASS